MLPPAETKLVYIYGNTIPVDAPARADLADKCDVTALAPAPAAYMGSLVLNQAVELSFRRKLSCRPQITCHF